MWLTIVSFLTCFNIGKARDEAGNEIEIDGTYYDVGIIRYFFELLDLNLPELISAVTRNLSSALSLLDPRRCVNLLRGLWVQKDMIDVILTFLWAFLQGKPFLHMGRLFRFQNHKNPDWGTTIPQSTAHPAAVL